MVCLAFEQNIEKLPRLPGISTSALKFGDGPLLVLDKPLVFGNVALSLG